jgi:hypothetical protein
MIDHLMGRTWDLLADLKVEIDGYTIDHHSRRVRPGYLRITNTYVLQGAGQEGRGEDITKWTPVAQAVVDRGPCHQLAGTFTLAEFSEYLTTLDLFPDRKPEFPTEDPYNRRWGFESAAADLALRQAGKSLHEVLGRPPRPVQFVASFGLGDPPSIEPVSKRLAVYPTLRFKLDASPPWLATPGLLDDLAATGAVDAIDFKGLYHNQLADIPADPELYRHVAETFPHVWLEDPNLDDPAADALLAPHRSRITWDAPIHRVADVEGLPFRPRALNIKPSRSGCWKDLLDLYDHCDREGITMYGGGQTELDVGRGHIELLAAMFHPDVPNDVAPAGYDHPDFPQSGLEASPLDPRADAVGFRRDTPVEPAS